jgi:hypothetical protein
MSGDPAKRDTAGPGDLGPRNRELASQSNPSKLLTRIHM